MRLDTDVLKTGSKWAYVSFCSLVDPSLTESLLVVLLERKAIGKYIPYHYRIVVVVLNLRNIITKFRGHTISRPQLPTLKCPD